MCMKTSTWAGLGNDVGHGFGSVMRLKNQSERFSGTRNGREGGENMDNAMLPSLRIGNTFTSKTEFRAKRNRTHGGGMNLVITDGVFCTSPANRGWADYGSGLGWWLKRFFRADCHLCAKAWGEPDVVRAA